MPRTAALLLTTLFVFMTSLAGAQRRPARSAAHGVPRTAAAERLPRRAYQEILRSAMASPYWSENASVKVVKTERRRWSAATDAEVQIHGPRFRAFGMGPDSEPVPLAKGTFFSSRQTTELSGGWVPIFPRLVYVE